MTRKTAYLSATLIVALCAFGTAPLFAEEDSADLFADSGSDTPATEGISNASAEPGSTAGGFTLKLSGSHKFDYRLPAYDDSWNYDSEMKSPAFKNDFGVEIQEGTLKIVSHWAVDALLSAQDNSTGQYGSWNDSTRIRPLENYVSWSPEGTGVRASFGYQIFAWGVADKVNPTDNLNPRDYTSSVIDPEKIPTLAADLLWYPTDALTIEGVFLPYEGADLWITDYAESVKDTIETTGTVTNNAIDYEPKNFVGGIKVSHRSDIGDFSASYLYDFDSYYSAEVSGTYGLVTKTGNIELERRRMHRFGADAKTTIGKYGLWLETCYSLTDRESGDDSIRHSKLDYVAGLDFNYGPNDSFYVNLQYIGSYIPGYDDDALDTARAYAGDYAYAESYMERTLANTIGAETEGMIHGCSANLKWELHDALITPQVKAVYYMPFNYDDSARKRYGSLAINPEIDLKPVDSFHIVAGAELHYSWVKPDGKDVELDTDTDKIGIYTPSNNVYLKVIYKWNYDLKK